MSQRRYLHCIWYACTQTARRPLCSGATMVYPAETFNPQATLEAVQAERCTSLCELGLGGGMPRL